MKNNSLLFSVRSHKNEKKVVADVNIPAATTLCNFNGPVIDYDITKGLGKKESYALQVGKDTYYLLDPPFRYFNHSCEPNCGLTPDLQLVSIRSIESLEELTYDYSTTMLERDWQMKCKCGKPGCRKIITDFDKLPTDLQKKYLGLNIVQEYIVKSIKITRNMTV